MNFIIEHIGLYIMKSGTTIFPIKAVYTMLKSYNPSTYMDVPDQQARYCYENRPPG